jgi:rhodanese-related sulfurtransferase
MGGVIIDVRNPVDYATGKIIHNALNVPAKDVVKWVISSVDIEENTPILLYSERGGQAESIKEDLTSSSVGYKNVVNLGSVDWYPHCSG